MSMIPRFTPAAAASRAPEVTDEAAPDALRDQNVQVSKGAECRVERWFLGACKAVRPQQQDCLHQHGWGTCAWQVLVRLRPAHPHERNVGNVAPLDEQNIRLRKENQVSCRKHPSHWAIMADLWQFVEPALAMQRLSRAMQANECSSRAMLTGLS